MSSSVSNHCLNCGNPVQGNFCTQCGQSISTGRITFKETFSNFLSSTFSFEGPLLITLHHLFLKPGTLFREFIAGKRKKYYQPVQFYVLLTAVYLIVRALLDYDPLEGRIDFVDEQGAVVIGKSKEAARFMVDNINNILFFLVFSIAIMLKLLYRKQYNLAEYTSVGLFITGIYLLLSIVMMIAVTLFNFNGYRLQLLVIFLLIGYSTGSLFNKFNFGSILKYLMVSVFSLIGYILLGFGFSFLMVSLR